MTAYFKWLHTEEEGEADSAAASKLSSPPSPLPPHLRPGASQPAPPPSATGAATAPALVVLSPKGELVLSPPQEIGTQSPPGGASPSGPSPMSIIPWNTAFIPTIPTGLFMATLSYPIAWLSFMTHSHSWVVTALTQAASHSSWAATSHPQRLLEAQVHVEGRHDAALEEGGEREPPRPPRPPRGGPRGGGAAAGGAPGNRGRRR